MRAVDTGAVVAEGWTTDKVSEPVRARLDGSDMNDPSPYPRAEVEAAFHEIVTTGDAGDGRFSLQEDVYNPNEGEAVVMRWLADGGQLAADPAALGIQA